MGLKVRLFINSKIESEKQEMRSFNFRFHISDFQFQLDWQGVCLLYIVKLNIMRIKLLVAAVLGLFISLHSHAQLKGFGIGPYAEMAWVTGDFKESNKNGIGVGLTGDIRLGKLGLTGSVGYMRFGGKTVNTGDGTVKMPTIAAIPIRAGFKYRLMPILYTKLEAGVANYTNDGGSAFILSPGIGVRLLGWDFQAKYETWIKDGSNAFWGVRVAHLF